MNRVVLCGVCVATVRGLLGETCAQVQVVTASDGSISTTIPAPDCHLEETGTSIARLERDGVCYLACASLDDQPGVTLRPIRQTDSPNMADLLETQPGMVCCLLQNISLQLKNEGVNVWFDVNVEE